MRRWGSVLLLLLLAVPAVAQSTDELALGKLYLGATTGCALQSGSGTPEGAVTGSVCDQYIDTATSDWYQKSSGTGNTGWSKLARLNAANVFTATQTIPTITAAATLTLSPTTDLVTDPTGNTVLPATGYDINIGTLQKKYLTLHAAELWVETLVAQNTIATIGGRILVGPTNVLVADVSAGATFFPVKYNSVASSDVVYLEADGKVEFVLVESVTVINAFIGSGGTGGFDLDWGGVACGYYTAGRHFRIAGSTGNDGTYAVASCNGTENPPYTRVYVAENVPSTVDDGYHLYFDDTASAGGYVYLVTRNRDGSGANAWYAGDAVFDTGVTGNGFIDLYSLRGVKASTEIGPTIVGNVRVSSTYNDWAPRWAVGRLDGLYGYTSTSCTGSVPCYGFAAGVPTGAWIKVDPTNGVRIGYDTTTKTQIDAAGNASFTGTVTAAAGAIGGWVITSTQILDNAVTPTIALKPGTGGDGYIWVSAGTTNVAGIYGGTLGTHVAFWAGDIAGNRAVAPFRVTYGGALTATSATITGAITATSGDITAAITAGSITSAMIAANTITAADIAAGTITTTEIAADTIAAGDIAANAITTSELDSDSVTSAKIAAGTIVASDIATGTITADRLSVSTLSAITADLGTVTAGTISGVTITGGSINIGTGNFTVNSFGVISATNGATFAGGVAFSSGAGIVSLAANTRFDFLNGSGNGYICFDDTSDYPYVNSTGCPSPVPNEIAQLRQEIAELRALVNEAVTGRRQ